jgi:hypothetical protein
MIRIYADFNSTDEEGRVWALLKRDLEEHSDELKEGLRVLLHMDDEFEVEATLVYDRGWMGVPDWSTIRYLDEGEGKPKEP